MLHYEHVFGNVFEKRESKCCRVLMKYHRKNKDEKVITLRMAQQLKTKNIKQYQDNYFAISVELNFCQRQTHCIDDQHEVQSVTDTDNELTECQRPRKKLQSIGISPARLHAFMETLKSNISEAYNVQVGCFKIQSLILMIKMI